METTMANPQQYYKDKSINIKPMAVYKRNKRRLDRTKDEDVFREVLSNTVEHCYVNVDGIRTIEIFITSEYIIIRNPMCEPENFSFGKFVEKFTSFIKESSTNLNEGLTTTMKYKTRFDFIGKYAVVNRKTDDGYYQDIDDATHIETHDGEIENKGTELIPDPYQGWMVTIYGDHREIFQKVLDSFIFITGHKFEISVNNEPYALNTVSSTFDTGLERIYEKGDIFYQLNEELDKDKQIVKIYWKLNVKGAYRQLSIESFNERGVSGYFILTSVNQFLDENRIGLHDYVVSDISSKIMYAAKQSDRDKKLEEEMNKFHTYRKSYCKYLVDVMKIPQYKAMKLFDKASWFDEDSDKTKDEKEFYILKKTTSFMNKIEDLQNTKILVNRDEGKSYKDDPSMIISRPDIFSIPEERIGYSSDYLTVKMFGIMGISIKEVRQIFDTKIGMSVVNGEIDSVVYAHDLPRLNTYNKNHLYFLVEDSSISEFDEFTTTKRILIYPTNTDYRIYTHDFENVSIDVEYKSEIDDDDDENTLIVDIFEKFSIGTAYNRYNEIEENTIEVNNEEYSLGIFLKSNRGNITQVPYLFNSDMDKRLHEAGGNIKNRVFPKPWEMYYNTINVVVRNLEDFDKTVIYPVFFTDHNELNKHFYHFETGILAINSNVIPSNLGKTQLLFWMIKEVSHILAHIKTPSHSSLHEKTMEDIMNVIICEKDIEEEKSIITVISKS